MAPALWCMRYVLRDGYDQPPVPTARIFLEPSTPKPLLIEINSALIIEIQRADLILPIPLTTSPFRPLHRSENDQRKAVAAVTDLCGAVQSALSGKAIKKMGPTAKCLSNLPTSLPPSGQHSQSRSNRWSLPDQVVSPSHGVHVLSQIPT